MTARPITRGKNKGGTQYFYKGKRMHRKDYSAVMEEPRFGGDTEWIEDIITRRLNG